MPLIVKNMFDCFNNTLQIGDTVAFVYNTATSSWLEKGTVVDFSSNYIKIEYTTRWNHKGTIRKSVNKVVKI